MQNEKEKRKQLLRNRENKNAKNEETFYKQMKTEKLKL